MNRDEIIAFLRGFRERSADKYGIIGLGVFGSVAREEMRDGSDVDIYIRTQSPNPFLLVHIKAEIEKQLHRRVDIVRVRDTMNPFLKKRIEEEGIRV
jgi:predicted nucleotidyltransferase